MLNGVKWCLALLALGCGLPSGVSGQRFPGAPGGDGLSAAANRAEYYADVMVNTLDLMTVWRGAWANDDAETLAETYTEDATFVFGTEMPIRGRDGIQERLSQLLSVSGEVQAALTDFDASGRMGMISGLLTIEVQEGGRSTSVDGIHLTVVIRRGRHWKIRSQLFRIDSGEVPPPGPTPG